MKHMLKTLSLLVIVCFIVISTSAQSKRTLSFPAEKLSFQELFAPDPDTLQPSEKLLRLRGKQVRIVGFMAQMENPPIGAFYLCPRPVKCDESGAGIGDLPVTSILVVAPSMKGRKIPFIARSIEATGRLEIGNDGEAAHALAPIRLILADHLATQRSNPRKKNH